MIFPGALTQNIGLYGITDVLIVLLKQSSLVNRPGLSGYQFKGISFGAEAFLLTCTNLFRVRGFR